MCLEQREATSMPLFHLSTYQPRRRDMYLVMMMCWLPEGSEGGFFKDSCEIILWRL